MKKNSSEQLKKIIPVLTILPFILGAAGYVMSGETLSDSLYGSFALYFVNPVSDGYNILIEIARWTAALVTTTAILYVIKRLWMNLWWELKCFSKDSVAVYCDTKVFFGDKKTKAFYPGRTFKRSAKSHIIILDSDADSLAFYEENKVKIKNSSVYIGLKEIEYGLLKDEPQATFFDIDGAIARNLWKQIGLWKERGGGKRIVAIYGTGHLGQNILNYGLLLNLYDRNQEITYNFIGTDNLYQITHQNLKTCNGDRVLFYSADDRSRWDVITGSDIVIVSEQLSVEELQAMGILCENGSVYYYSPGDGEPGRYLKLSNLIPFGRNTEIYTDENIRRGKMVERAKQLNYEYAVKYHTEKDWNKLDGFTKWSNISSADFNEVLEDIIEADGDADLEELAELEHIRFVRFHYLNYWKFGIPQNGKNKDAEKKIHKCLCDYEKLDEIDKEKDRAIIRRIFEKS